jgi:S1-C subfamily serine protease
MLRFVAVAWGLAQLIVAASVASAVAGPAPDIAGADTEMIQTVFQRATRSVVSVRARSRAVIPGTRIRFTEAGSGVLISADGKVLTAAQLVYAMDEIAVVFSTGETTAAKVIASESAARDLAVLQLERVPQGAIISPMADSISVAAGDRAFIVSASYRRPHTLSVGSIKEAWSSDEVAMPLVEFFEGDVVLDMSSSGAPMFDLNGTVIGVVSQKLSTGNTSERTEFVVTVNMTRLLQLDAGRARLRG